MLEQAIKLQNAINKIPELLNPIGHCHYEEYYHNGERDNDANSDHSDNADISDNEHNSDSDNDDTIEKKINKYKYLGQMQLLGNIKRKLQLELDGDIFTQDKVNSSYKLKLLHFDYDHHISINQYTLESLYRSADKATYGDLASMSTKVDNTVRSGAQITADYFEVDPKLVKKLENGWAKKMMPKKVRVEPYKINLYKVGDFFKKHRDTPSRNMVGTILVSLSDQNKCSRIDEIRQGGQLILNNGQHEWMPTAAGDWCGFYADIEHEVMPVTSGIRATLAFKVFSLDSSLLSLSKEKVHKIMSFVDKLPKPCGFILGHKYSLNTTSTKGLDNILLTALSNLGSITRLPVCVKYSSIDSNDNDEVQSKIQVNVYPLTDNCIDYALDTSKPVPKMLFDNGINFILIEKGYEWYNKDQYYIEHTGNECQPENIDSLYLNHAVILN